MNLQPLKRRVADCQHRQPASLNADDVNVCGLLRDISGIQNDTVLIVEEEVCKACCNSFQPTIHDWNPTIASLLHRVAESIIAAGGIHGFTTENAQRLAEVAIKSLSIVLPDEDDGVDDIQSFQVPRQITFKELCRVLPLPNSSKPLKNTPIGWNVGVTTAPRRQPTLSTSLTSLISSGWQKPYLFIDGEVSIDACFSDFPTTHRNESIGAWPAWVEALRGLIDHSDHGDAIAIVQDDALFPGVPVLKEYVDHLIWPGDQPAILSLYTSTDDMLSENKWRALPSRWKYGAVAFVFPYEIACELLESADSGNLNFINGTAGIDTRIGVWAERMGIPVWHPSPSLVQHIGQISSIWNQSRAIGLRRANRFLANELVDLNSERQ